MTDIPHGELRGYLRGCRCPQCRKANRIYQADRRARLAAVPDKQKPHGTTNGYFNYGCRCDACTQATRDYQAARRTA